MVRPTKTNTTPAAIHAVEAVRSSAAGALGKIGPLAKEAVPALKKALEDDDAGVREAAAEALRKIQRSTDETP